jgi:formamidopyrimidine-DNA glycosylase
MPELPEVETSRRGIEPYCLNQKIVSVDVRQPKLRWPVEPSLTKKLKGLNVNQVERRGKYILLKTDKGSLMIHLGMSGSLRIVDKKSVPEKHDHVDLVFSNNKIVRYNDPRRFGSVIYNKQGLEHPLLVKLGVEPLTETFDMNYLYQICQQRKAAIKVVIMNSHIVVGVGNIYAQEALFQAGINPNRAANKVSKPRIEKLVVAIKTILQQAIKAGGSSLRDFTSAEGKPGYFQQTHQVYGRGGEPCSTCGKLLKQVTIGQRTTVYCTACQK